MFFVLSGYLMCSTLFRDGMLSGPNIFRFLIRRVGRIYPMYLFQIGCVCLLTISLHPEQWPLLEGRLVDLLTFRKPVGDWFGYGIGVLWTLYIEFWFYVTFPLVMVALLAVPVRASKHTKLLCGFAAIAVTVIVTRALGAIPSPVWFYDHFLLGASIVLLERSGAVRKMVKPATLLWGAIIIVFALSIPFPGDRNNIWMLQSMAAALGTALVILAAATRPTKYHFPTVSFIARISYSIYLVHALVLDAFPNLAHDSLTGLVVYLALVLTISWTTERFIERPFNYLIHERMRFDLNRISTGSAA
jgi:peptidoglycan/LPS O-acetylase OafA/YrhL